MLCQSTLHVEVHARTVVSTGLSHGPHELEAADVEEGADDEHADVEGEVAVAHHGVGGEVESVDSEDHVPVESQRLNVLLQDLARAPSAFLPLLLSKGLHLYSNISCRSESSNISL